MEFALYVYYSCENGRETGRTKLTLCDFDTKSIRDVKYAIQDALQAPVCDQRLFYQGKPLTDDGMTLSRLYFREGDCFHVKFLAVADIPGICELLDKLKAAAYEIVEDRHNELPNVVERPREIRRPGKRLVDVVNGLGTFFLPWKNLRSVAQRHYFVQEGGFDAFLEVFKFSQQLYLVKHDAIDFPVDYEVYEEEMLKHEFNKAQLWLQVHCLDFLWNFAETPEDRKFVLSKGILPLTIESLLLDPEPVARNGYEPYSSFYTSINETAIGCCGGLVESDSATQEEVSRMTAFIEKILFMIDRRESSHNWLEYSLFSSQVASNTLFYCTFNVRSAPLLLDCGALTKMLDITRHFLLDKDGNAPLRYYCCLFLARMRSAPLIKLDRHTCGIIDELINVFLEKHLPSEISTWEEETSFVWMTMVPLFHLAFAAGNESGSNQGNCNNGLTCNTLQSTHQCYVESEQSTSSVLLEQASQVPLSQQLSSGWEACSQATSTLAKQEPASPANGCEELVQDKMRKCEELESQQTTEVSDSSHVVAESMLAHQGTPFTWPGSKSTRQLGIFSLVHMLSIKENQMLASSENLVEYLVCLSWQLGSDDLKYIRWSLSNFQLVSPPSLKVIAKSVLACVNGLDMVYHC